MFEKPYFVFILASRQTGGALYIGLTNTLKRRMIEHRDGIGARHTKRYGIDRLVITNPSKI